MSIYDAAAKELRAVYGKEKFPSRKDVQTQLTALQAEYHNAYKNFCTDRAHYNETRTLRINFHALLDEEVPRQGLEQDQKQEHH